MDTVEFILNKYGLDKNARPPHFLNISRHRGLPELFRDLGFQKGAEIGVETGAFSEQLCQKIPGLALYCVDAWQAYHGYRDHVSQEKLDGFYAEARKRLEPYGCRFVREYSVAAARQFADRSLDFVYIDANHDFLHVTQDIAAWSPKVRKGGILAGHDFRRSKNDLWECNVKDVVQAWAYSHKINPWFVVTHDKSPSWFWVC